MDFPDNYHPDFEEECRICGTSPTVIVEGHVQPDTYLCGCCFFKDKSMIDWTLWNDDEPLNQDTSETEDEL